MLLIVPVVLLVEKKGVRFSLSIGLILQMFTCIILAISNLHGNNTPIFMLLMKASRSFIVYPVAKFSASTFKPSERSFATGFLMGVESVG